MFYFNKKKVQVHICNKLKLIIFIFKNYLYNVVIYFFRKKQNNQWIRDLVKQKKKYWKSIGETEQQITQPIRYQISTTSFQYEPKMFSLTFQLLFRHDGANVI